MLLRVTHATKAQAAAEAIREAIWSGMLRPGQRLTLRLLQEQLGLSSSPIREALQGLIADGIVVDDPHRGVSVASFTLPDALEIYAIRARLESWATELATPHIGPAERRRLSAETAAMRRHHRQGNPRGTRLANRSFHMEIYRASGWPHLCDIIEQLWRKSPWGTLRVVPGRLEQTIREHQEIIRALATGDPQRAAAAMRQHLESAAAGLQAHFRMDSGPKAIARN